MAVKVYNKGDRPIVWKRGRNGVEAIHPNKYDLFSKEKADEIVKKFEDACYEADFENTSGKESAKPEKKTSKKD